MWQGLTPALLRQISYGSLRIGLYEPIKNALTSGEIDSYNSKKVPLHLKVVAASLSGTIAAGICTPTDVVKVTG